MTTLQFPESLPGLAPLKEFTLSAVEDSVGLYSLDSAELSEVKFFLLDPALHLPDYSPSLQGHLDTIGDPDPQEVRTLVIVNTSDREPHVNLLAPLVINATTRQAAQVILDSQQLPVRAPLPGLSSE